MKTYTTLDEYNDALKRWNGNKTDDSKLLTLVAVYHKLQLKDMAKVRRNHNQILKENKLPLIKQVTETTQDFKKNVTFSSTNTVRVISEDDAEYESTIETNSITNKINSLGLNVELDILPPLQIETKEANKEVEIEKKEEVVKAPTSQGWYDYLWSFLPF